MERGLGGERSMVCTSRLAHAQPVPAIKQLEAERGGERGEGRRHERLASLPRRLAEQLHHRELDEMLELGLRLHTLGYNIAQAQARPFMQLRLVHKG